MNPQVFRQLADDRHREMLAQAEQHRLARQVSGPARASHLTGQARGRMRRATRMVRRLRSQPGQ
ncbi:MAG TPA: hypothetical protein VEC76_14480 [Streptosporangiaceae bacterium]|nr:hypothetical protein [Streptosporangiaceae bacterium]